MSSPGTPPAIWPDCLFVDATPAAVAAATAACLVDDLRAILAERAVAQLVLPTGASPLCTYALLHSRYGQALPWERVQLWQMDEYAGLAVDDPRRFSAFLRQHLVDPLGCQLRPLHGAEDATELAAYEAEIGAAGGLDLVLLGVGINGHLGFNEPGTSFAAPSRPVILHASTRARIDPAAGAAPTAAVTLGLPILSAARRLRLIALGAAKRDALQRGLLQPPDIQMPLSCLQRRADVRYFFDAAACPEALRRGAPTP